jgi:hypothetical protein
MYFLLVVEMEAQSEVELKISIVNGLLSGLQYPGAPPSPVTTTSIVN